jgi:MFS transporter, FSR family, fosmidomycin resistance protein
MDKSINRRPRTQRDQSSQLVRNEACHTGNNPNPVGGFRLFMKNKRIMAGSLLAHLTHDGFTDMLYVFFPVWQAQFGLALAQVGFLKLLFSGTLAFLQVPSSLMAKRIGTVRLLLAGTFLTSAAVFTYGWATAPSALACLLVIGGLGASVQHPLCSTLVSSTYEENESRRAAISIYNVSGDIGKLLFPAVAALLITRFGWPFATRCMGVFGFAVVAVLIAFAAPMTAKAFVAERPESHTESRSSSGMINSGFVALLSIGILDSATRMGFLTYFPFLLRDKGAEIAFTGSALSLIFAGGVAGKFACGLLATRVGVLRSVLITETLTAVCIWASILLPLDSVVLLCPVLGIALNGTSSILYGSVPELVPERMRSRSFAVFYTATIGAGAVSPFVYGLAGDALGVVSTLALAGAIILAALPLTLPLRGKVGATVKG